MDVVLWILGIVFALAALAYGAIGVCVLVAKYRMTHVPAQRARATLAAGSIVDWRYPTH